MARLLLPALVLLGVLALGAAASQAAPPVTGDWVVTGDEYYANQTITLDGNLTVAPAGNLTLENVTLQIVSPSSGRRGVTVQPNGRLTTLDGDGSAATPLDRTRIRPTVSTDRISFVAEPGSIVNLTQTEFTGIGYTQSPSNASGLYLDHAFVGMSNVTVWNSYFGIVMLGEFANVTLANLNVHNNTYDGVLINGATNVFLRSFVSADNGAAGVEMSNGSATFRSANFLRNSDGLAIKFGALANVQVFDASGNQNGVVLLNGASAYLSLGRVTNSTTNGLDARLSSVAYLSGVTFSDNTVHAYATGGSTVDQTGGRMDGGVVGYHLRTASTLRVFNASLQGLTGAAFDIDASSADLSRLTITGVPVGGTVVGGTGFVFLDSTMTGCTVGGLAFINTTGVILNNPTFRDNRGSSVSMVGSSTGLLTGGLVSTFVNTTVRLDRVDVTGTLWVQNSTLHAMRARAWQVTGTFHGEAGGLVGDVVGTVLTVRDAASLHLSQFGVSDLTLRVDGAPTTSLVDGFSVQGTGALEAVNGSFAAWRNVTANTGGVVRVLVGQLELIGGTATNLEVGLGSKMWIRDFLADVPGATVGPGAFLYESWTTGVDTLWAPGVVAPLQSVSLLNTTGATVAQGTSDASGHFAAGYVQSRTATPSGVVTDNPFTIAAGSAPWNVSAAASITAPTLVVVQLNDSIRPRVQITRPTGGASTSEQPVVVTGSVVEQESGLVQLAWSFDNASFTTTTASANFSFSIPAPFNASYTVTVRATDLAGNQGYGAVTFTVDRVAPTITLSGPANGSRLQGPDVQVTGRTEPGVNLTVAGQPVTPDSNGDFSVTLTLSEGPHRIDLVAVDAALNTGSASVNVTIDSTPPAIIVESPLNGTVLSVSQATLVGRVEPGASLAVDGLPYIVLPNGSFSADAFLDTEGPNTFTLTSVDFAGNTNTIVWVLVRDTAPPVIQVGNFSGPGPFLVNTTAPTLLITVDEEAVIEASTGLGDNLATYTGRSGEYHPVLLEGNTTVVVNATDLGGNRASLVFVLRVDATPPTFTLDAATAAGLASHSPFTVSVTTEAGATVTFSGVAAAPATPGGTTYTASIPLVEGPNAVALVITDAAGNVRSANLVITLDTQPPSLTVTAPGDGERLTQETVRVTGTAEPGATVTVGGGAVPVDGAGSFSVDYPLVRGENRIVVEARDAAGNMASVARTVTREGGGGAGVTGVPFIDDNLYFLLILVAAAVAAAAVAARGRRKRKQLADQAAMIGGDLDSSVTMRGDLGAMDDFTPARVNDPDFESFEEFQRRQGGRPPGR